MMLVWVVIPLVLFGIVGVQESFAKDTPQDYRMVLTDIEGNSSGPENLGDEKFIAFHSSTSFNNKGNPIEAKIRIVCGPNNIVLYDETKIFSISDPRTIIDSFTFSFSGVYTLSMMTEEIPSIPSISLISSLSGNYDDHCDPESVKKLPPLRQISAGISYDNVVCKEELFLIIKYGGSPACVTPETAEKLIERGWAINEESRGINQLEQNIQNQIIQTIPASSGTVVNFYVNDDDLNISPNGVDMVSTSGLIEITINGVMIDAPKKMIETSPNSGKFFLKIELPETINGKPLDQNDIFLIKYIDESDASGEKRIIVESFPLTKTFAKLQTYDGGNRIGHEFTLRLYEPDSNRDSRDEDKISLSALEFRSEGGIRTILSNPAFDANSSFLTETGPNTSIFEVKIKIPRSIDGKTIHIGDWYEIRYIDRSTPSGTNEKIILEGKIGLQ